MPYLPELPTRTIFPLLTDGPSWRPSRFLGTGFFVRVDGVFLTAGHVLRGIELADGEFVVAGLRPAEVTEPLAYRIPVSPLRVDLYEISDEYDVAVGHVDGLDAAQPLELARVQPPMNQDVLAVEYSGTTQRMEQDGSRSMDLIPQFRKGNVLRYYHSTWPESRPTMSLDLSFPALKGASGAPVIDELSASVVGMLLANVERHLLPAQIETIQSETGEVETRTYFLPTSKAIGWQHLRECLDSYVSRHGLPDGLQPPQAQNP